jgi:hypothetical protein
VRGGSSRNRQKLLAIGNLIALQNKDEGGGKCSAGNASPGHVTLICKEFHGEGA